MTITDENQPTQGPRWQGLLIALTDILACGLIAILLLWWLTGEYFFFISLFVNLMPGAFFSSVPLLLMAILLRSRRTLIFAVVPLIVFFILYGSALLPTSTPDDLPESNLTLLSYNMLVTRTEPELFDAILGDNLADVVNLQEVNPEVAAHLLANWSDEYPYHVSFRPEENLEERLSRFSGRLILSRYPILNDSATAYGIHLSHVQTDLAINGQIIPIFNVHLPPPSYLGTFSSSNRSSALDDLLNQAAPYDNVILFGDFNMTDQTDDYRRLRARYTDVYQARGAGFGLTYPNVGGFYGLSGFLPPIIRIDYAFVGGDIQPVAARVVADGQSDHTPLWVEVALPNESDEE